MSSCPVRCNIFLHSHTQIHNRQSEPTPAIENGIADADGRKPQTHTRAKLCRRADPIWANNVTDVYRRQRSPFERRESARRVSCVSCECGVKLSTMLRLAVALVGVCLLIAQRSVAATAPQLITRSADDGSNAVGDSDGDGGAPDRNVTVGPCTWIVTQGCPDDDNIGVYLFTRRNPNDRQRVHIASTWERSNLSESYFDPAHPVKIIIHGYNADMFLSSLIDMKDGELNRMCLCVYNVTLEGLNRILICL